MTPPILSSSTDKRSNSKPRKEGKKLTSKSSNASRQTRQDARSPRPVDQNPSSTPSNASPSRPPPAYEESDSSSQATRQEPNRFRDQSRTHSVDSTALLVLPPDLIPSPRRRQQPSANAAAPGKQLRPPQQQQASELQRSMLSRSLGRQGSSKPSDLSNASPTAGSSSPQNAPSPALQAGVQTNNSLPRMQSSSPDFRAPRHAAAPRYQEEHPIRPLPVAIQAVSSSPLKEVSFAADHTVIPGPIWRYSTTSSMMPEDQEQFDLVEITGVSPMKLDQVAIPSVTLPPSPTRLVQRSSDGPIDIQSHYKQLRFILAQKQLNMKNATRRLRHMEGLAAAFWTTIGLILCAVSIIVIIFHWPTGAPKSELTTYYLLIGIVPISALLACIGIGVLLTVLRTSHLFIRQDHLAFEYMETLNMILNLSRLLVDIDNSPVVDNRHVLLQECSDCLTSALLLKQRYEAASTSKLVRRILCKIFFAPAYLLFYLFAGCCIPMSQKPKDGKASIVPAFSAGCLVYSFGIAACCCVSHQERWLDEVDDEARSAVSSSASSGWGSIEIIEA